MSVLNLQVRFEFCANLRVHGKLLTNCCELSPKSWIQKLFQEKILYSGDCFIIYCRYSLVAAFFVMANFYRDHGAGWAGLAIAHLLIGNKWLYFC